MNTATIRRAGPDDIARVADLWTQASEALAARGSDQWQYPVKVHNIRATVAAGTCWVIDDGHPLPAATVTLDEDAEATLWRPDDLPDNALYVHRLVVRRDLTGISLGSSILDWCGRRAAAAGRMYVRLDAWTTSFGLHRYYQGQRFELVRVIPGEVSGVLFQRPTWKAMFRGPMVTDVPFRTAS